ncbi:related to siderophore iron transporter mirB [Rhynchosporium agropyri]|uniref:Related to siderophore iron transporter mirB n=1 Tax=Rhynchosporium agropyri TaxID=914238 RepID=A0A1E1KJ08_9HELO|nr:related to siderophore iron transporter mirB [Rhynchosporium agropyri]
MNTALEKNVSEAHVYQTTATFQANASELKDTIDVKVPSVNYEDEESKPVASTTPAGVRQMEAITLVWTKPWMITAFGFIWLIFFTDSLQQQSNFSWTPSVTTLVLMGICRNVQTYAAAQVFYWTGMNGIAYVMNVFIADTSSMKNRALLFALTTTPYISNTFAGPSLGQAFLDHSTWRWGYGAFAIITPLMCIPFWTIFVIMTRRARGQEIIVKEKSGRSAPHSVVFWLVEFDVVGLLLICGGFSLLLLPFSLAAYQGQGWKSPLIICMIIFGAVLLVAFALWEKFLAPKIFFPFHLLTNRSVVGACLLGGNLWISFYSYKMYFSSYLQVVFQLSVSKAGYITNIFNIVSCTMGPIIALIIRRTDRFRWVLLAAFSVQVLMTALMIHFRQPSTQIALLVMVEVFAAICGAAFVLGEQLAAMNAVPHENVAVSLALLGMITSLGGSIGMAISGAIWTQTLPGKIEQYLPADMKNETMKIYASLVTQLSYEWDSPVRQAVVEAYGDTQRLMVITGLVTLLPCIIWIMMIKNFKLSEHKQNGGLVL